MISEDLLLPQTDLGCRAKLFPVWLCVPSLLCDVFRVDVNHWLACLRFLLIAAGANVNAKTDYGETPLDRPLRYELTEVVNLLRNHGGKTARELKAEGK